MPTTTWTDDIQPKEEQFKLKKEALLRTAAQAFNEDGFHKTSLNNLAKRLNVTKPTLYYYVKDKDDILFEIQHKALVDMHKVLEELSRSSENGIGKLNYIMERYAEVITDDYGRCLVLIGMGALKPQSREKLMQVRRTLNKEVHRLIALGIEDGSIKPCDIKLTTNALFGAFNWISHWYQDGSAQSPTEVAHYYLKLFANGMAAVEVE